MQRKSIKINLALNSVRMGVSVLVPLITFPYISRIFSTDGIGKINFASSVVQIFTLTASLGIYTYGVREGVKVRDNKTLFTKFASELFAINIVSTALTYIVFLFSVFFIDHFSEYKALLLIDGVAIGFAALGLDWVYGVYEEYLYITVRQIIVQVFTVIAMLLFVHESADIFIWAILLMVSSVGANIFNFFNALKYLSKKDIQVDFHRLPIHFEPIIVLFVTQLAAKVYSNLDTVLLGLMSNDHHIGLYSAAVKVNIVLNTCFIAMFPVFIPKIMHCLDNNDKEQYFTFFSRITRFITALGVPIVTGMEMMSGQIIKILSGQVFMAAKYTLEILAPIVLVSAYTNTLFNNFFVPLKKEKTVLLLQLLSAGINLLISIVLIPHFQENGAAIGSLFSEIIVMAAAFVIAVKYDRRMIYSIPKCRNYIIGLIAIVLWCLFCRRVIHGFWLNTVLSITGSILLYFMILFITRDIVGIELINTLKSVKRVK